MGFHQDKILPVLIARGMDNKVMRKHRPRIPPLARGRVLEVGLEPSRALLEKAYFDGPRFISYHYIGQAEPR